jgi:hypothetical protein
VLLLSTKLLLCVILCAFVRCLGVGVGVIVVGVGVHLCGCVRCVGVSVC